MKKLSIAIASIFLIGATAFAQELIPDQNEKGKWGYVDANGKKVINYDYTEASAFIDGRAKVRKGNKWGYINPQGKEVIKIKYSEMKAWNGTYCKVAEGGSFDDGVLSGEKWGYINRSGDVIIPAEYDEIGVFTDGIAFIRKGDKYGYINDSYKIFIPCEFNAVGSFNKEGFCWVNKGGSFEKESPSKISGGKFGVYNLRGEEIVPVEYASIGTFTPWVYHWSKEELDKKEFYTKMIIQEAGTKRILVKSSIDRTKFSKIEMPINTDFFVSKKDDTTKNGVISAYGEVLIPADKFYCAFGPEEGIAPVIPKKDKGYNYYDISAKMLLYKNNVADTYSFQDGVAIQAEDLKASKGKTSKRQWYLVDKSGACISSKYSTIMPRKNDTYLVQIEDNSWGLIDAKGNEIIAPKYNKILPLSEGLLAARESENDKFGFIDLTGKYIIKPTFNSVYSFKHGYATVKTDNGWGIIDTTGKEIIPCQWNSLKFITQDNPQTQWVQKENNGPWICLDFATAKPLFDKGYANVANFNYAFEGIAFVWDNNNKVGVIDTTGKEIIPCSLTSYDLAKSAYEMMLQRGKIIWTETDSYRFDLMHNDKRNSYQLTDRIHSSMWDY